MVSLYATSSVMVCTWLREISIFSRLTVLPGHAVVMLKLNKINQPLFLISPFQKMPDEFGVHFRREGVLHQVQKLMDPDNPICTSQGRNSIEKNGFRPVLGPVFRQKLGQARTYVPAYSDTLGTRQKCHCKQIVTLSRCFFTCSEAVRSTGAF